MLRVAATSRTVSMRAAVKFQESCRAGHYASGDASDEKTGRSASYSRLYLA